MVPLSVLDLCPIVEGGTAALALRNSVDLAQHAERWGYRRFWLAEHHNFAGIASAATAVVVGHVAGATSTIRVGAGGIMLPNHAPLVVAEQFGTLESLYPGRIDLGLGRAPGTDRLTSVALRRDLNSRAEAFQDDVVELRSYFEPGASRERVRAIPGAGLQVPLYILGSSLFGAGVAARLGLPFAFASHFAPAQLDAALSMYRAAFQPSPSRTSPYVFVTLNVFAADTDVDGERLFTSLTQAFTALRRGRPGPLPPPADVSGQMTEAERAELESALACSLVGSRDSVRRGLLEFIERTRPDEILVTGMIYDHAARLRSFEIVSELRAELAGAGR